MLSVIEYLKSGKTLDDLYNEFAISHKIKDDMVILVYSQIDSPKMKPIVQECRGLCLQLNTWKIIAMPFVRFFNEGEALDITDKFNWNNFSGMTKEDGSFVKIFWYNNKLNIQTRGSFADSELIPNLTWENAIKNCLTEKQIEYIKIQKSPTTFLFEYCSLKNQVVRQYPEDKLILLSINCSIENGYDYIEIDESIVDSVAEAFSFERPEKFNFASIDEVKNELHKISSNDNTFEGFVLKDSNNMRLKVKSPLYLELHSMAGNGEITSFKNLLPFVLTNETDELISLFPYVKDITNELILKVDTLRNNLLQSYNIVKNISDQKEFALKLQELKEPLSSILFKIKKNGNIDKQDVLDLEFRNNKELLLKILKD